MAKYRPPAQPAAPRSRWQLAFNVYLFLNFAGWFMWQGWSAWRDGTFDYVTAAFIVQSSIMVALLLLRRDHLAVDTNPWHQAIALTAFMSGMLFVGTPPTGGPIVAAMARLVTLAANLFGIITLFNLGRSFGILIALREVKTTGLYGWVRHPMYGTDILLRVGFVIGHFSAWTVALFVLSSACYVWRALLEERFLAREPAYRQYMRKVRYRFMPGIW